MLKILFPGINMVGRETMVELRNKRYHGFDNNYYGAGAYGSGEVACVIKKKILSNR